MVETGYTPSQEEAQNHIGEQPQLAPEPTPQKQADVIETPPRQKEADSRELARVPVQKEKVLSPSDLIKGLREDMEKQYGGKLPTKTLVMLKSLEPLAALFSALKKNPETLKGLSVREYGWQNYLLQRAVEGCRTNYFTALNIENIEVKERAPQGKQAELAARSIKALLEHDERMHSDSPMIATQPRRRKSEEDPNIVETYLQELSMKQHETFMGTTIRPKGKTAEIVPQNRDANFVIVLIEGESYQVEVKSAEGTPYDTDEIYQRIQQVQNLHALQRNTLENDQNRNIVSLSGAPDGKWDAVYNTLKKNPQDQENLKKLEDALFVVCLDEKLPDDASQEEIEQTFRNGGAFNRKNRFHGKNQLIIPQGGEYIGFEWNHVVIDGSSAREIQEELQKKLKDIQITHTNDNPNEVASDSVRLKWNLSNAALIEKAEKSLNDLLDAQTSKVLETNVLTKELLKKYKCSPDTIVQLAVLATYARIENHDLPSTASVVNNRGEDGRLDLIKPSSTIARRFAKLLNTFKAHPELLEIIRVQNTQPLPQDLPTSIKIKEILDDEVIDKDMFIKILKQSLGLTHFEEIFRDAEKSITNEINKVRDSEGIYTHLMAITPAILAEFGAGELGSFTEEALCKIDKIFRETLMPQMILSNGGVDGLFGTVPSRAFFEQGDGAMAIGYAIGDDGVKFNILGEGRFGGEFTERFKNELEKTLTLINTVFKVKTAST